jgi:hypothetical protein
LSGSHQASRPEDAPQLFTLAALSAEFGYTEKTIRKYLGWGIVPRPIGHYHGGANYDHTHYQALARHRAEREADIPLRERASRARRPHVVVRVPRESAGVS